MVNIKYPFPQRFHYLMINGKYITPNTIIAASGTITGALTTTKASDYMQTPNHKELVLNFAVQSVSGTSPTLDIYLDVLNPVEPQNKNITASEQSPMLSLKLDNTTFTAAGTLRVVIANGTITSWENGTQTVLGNLNVPFLWQVRFVIGGTSPSFGVVATYEARE